MSEPDQGLDQLASIILSVQSAPNTITAVLKDLRTRTLLPKETAISRAMAIFAVEWAEAYLQGIELDRKYRETREAAANAWLEAAAVMLSAAEYEHPDDVERFNT